MSLFDLDEPLDLNEQKGLPHVNAIKRPLLEHDKDHDYILRIDNTTLEIFQGCPRAAEFYCVNRRQAIPSAALQFGGAVHVGLEHLYRHGFHELSFAIDAALKNLDEIKFRDPEEWRTPLVLQDTLEKYVEKYGGDDAVKPIKVDGEKFIERPFSLVLGEIEINDKLSYSSQTLTQTGNETEGLYIAKLTILWSGRIDIAANYGDAHVYVVDHKTTSIGGPQFFADFMLSQQMVGYNWALRRMLPSHAVLGTVVNAIMQRRPTKTGRALEFERQVYFHTKWHIEEWERDVMSQVETFVHSLNEGFFPKQTKQCFGRYGKCPYHDVCSIPPNQRHLILGSDEYSNVTWSPLDAR
jgi:hypothetical protein